MIEDAKEIAELRKRVIQLENWILNSTKKRPSTALDFLDEKANEILRERKSCGKE